ncbi:MAG: hypothetical protein PHR68_01935 [Candidatus Gracilibacteria bacterium]|nr:hypothetical protein [Candidatus Gracilibacteria bacterium]
MKPKIFFLFLIFINLLLTSILYFNLNILIQENILLIEDISFFKCLAIVTILLIAYTITNMKKGKNIIIYILQYIITFIIIMFSFSIVVYSVWNVFVYKHLLNMPEISFSTSSLFSLGITIYFLWINMKENIKETIIHFFKKDKSTD